MVKGFVTPSLATARANSAELTNSTDSTAVMIMDATAEVTRSVSFDDEEARGHGSDDEEELEMKAEYDAVKSTTELLDEVEELSLQVGRVGNPRPVQRNLTAELGDDADDDDDDVAPGDRPPLIPRATKNADTPSANKVLARLGEEMKTQSDWMVMFGPVAMARAKWPMLGPELAQPVNSTDVNQLAEDTMLLLKAMGYQCTSRPSSLMLDGWTPRRASLELMRWKRRLRWAFGLEQPAGPRQSIAKRTAEPQQLGEDPSRIPLPKTPETKKGRREVFRATEGTPYFEDSHMKTPVRERSRGVGTPSSTTRRTKQNSAETTTMRKGSTKTRRRR
ncbi:uncharacterized protein IUM83_12050 [Phytophthora cinnamomi]|uniref:uncharacterized protein n=1 Tax=Phytophthora cinnamomi TaxID=4785 RepID=UPI00355AC869|nr:hypothetical protein IUM83_12050 [Phytophthora cinnamomi]